MQNALLTQTKFIPPRLRDDFVPRPRLLDALRTAIDTCALTLISAPAGYGKTTLVASLPAAFPGKPLAWISIEEEDNEPVRFLAALVTALKRLDASFGEDILALPANLESPSAEARRIMGVMINEVVEKLPELWLVLDDLHLITEPAIYAALDYLLERLPLQMRVIIATRHDPPLSLARLRARGQLAELRVSDLRFTTGEAELFLNEKQRLRLSSDDLAKLQWRAEGWAAGLRLLAGSLDHMASHLDRRAFIQDLALTNRYVFDFLADEVLKRQEAEVRAFLLETSILPEMTASLCAAVTGRSDAQSVLESLYRRNLFLVQVDEAGGAYRYHALFAQFLRQKLGREMPDRVVKLHKRAGDAQKETAPANSIAHYLAAEQWADAAQTIEKVGGELSRQGWFRTLRGWIEALPVPLREAHPRLLYYLGLCALQRGEAVNAMPLLESAQRGFETGNDAVGQGDTLLLMVETAGRRHDYARQATLTQQALKFPLPFHGQVLLLLMRVWELLYQGNAEQADSDLDKVLNLTLASNDVRAFNAVTPNFYMHLALLPSGPARLERYCREVLSRFGGEVVFSQACAHSLLSYLLFLKGALDESAQEAEQARSSLQQAAGFSFIEAQARGFQGMVAAVHGDYPRVEELWAPYLAELERAPSLHPYLVWVLYFIGRAQWMQGKLDEAREVEARIAANANPKELPEVTVTRKLMRALIEIGDRKFADAERTLQEALPIEERWGHAGILGSARVLMAYLHLQCKREKEAWSQFAPFLTECERRNMPGLVLQETAIAIPLLRLAVERKSHVDFAKRLLEELDVARGPEPVVVPETGQTLTRRELDVLKRIICGDSNHDIAQRLVISQHTVKVHITNIFAKLQVTSRTQAAVRASELHLV